MVFVPPQSGVSGAARFLGGCGNACLEGPALDWLLPPRCNLRVFRPPIRGEMAEWLKAHAWKACIGETLSRVRIPLSPPFPFETPDFQAVAAYYRCGNENS